MLGSPGDGGVSISGLTSSTVAECRQALKAVHFCPDVLRRALAEVDLAVHAALHVVHIVVDHRQSDAYGEHSNHRKGDSRVGDEAIGFDPRFEVHAGRCGGR